MSKLCLFSPVKLPEGFLGSHCSRALGGLIIRRSVVRIHPGPQTAPTAFPKPILYSATRPEPASYAGSKHLATASHTSREVARRVILRIAWVRAGEVLVTGL